MSANNSLTALADERGWFIVSATFKQSGDDVRDRRKSYYYPEGFSGKAMLDAFDQIARKYPVDTGRIFLLGLSGGAQFVHRFALWTPERVVAVAVNSSSWFDEPGEMAHLPAWLITVGDSDPTYDASLQFVDHLRQAGATPIFRSYLGMTHEGSSRVNRLNEAFLTFYDDLTRDQLGTTLTMAERQNRRPPLAADAMPFVGDAQDWRFYPNTEEDRDNLPEETRVFLPSEPIALLWSESEDGR